MDDNRDQGAAWVATDAGDLVEVIVVVIQALVTFIIPLWIALLGEPPWFILKLWKLF
jgi:hypothetical protein